MKLAIWATVALQVATTLGQDILTVLNGGSGLSKFTTYLKEFPDLITELNGGGFTVLAPTDDAFTNLDTSTNTVNLSDSTQLQAFLEYHIVQSVNPSASFSSTPGFYATLLDDPRFSNVSGGQRVEIKANGTVSIFSAVKQVSTIVTPDNLFTGGVIHTIDKPLTMPLLVPATLTQAKLNDLIGLLGKYHWLTDPRVLEIVVGTKNLSLFVPNSPDFSSTYTGFDGLSQEALTEIFEYSLVATDEPIYSDQLTNGTVFTTVLGKPITVTKINNDTYINDAKLIDPDYLLTNGVLQILDSPLNPNQTDARPASTLTGSGSTDTSTDSSSGGMSTAAKAGIVCGVLVVLLFGGLLAAVFFFRKRRSQKAGEQLPSPANMSGATTPSLRSKASKTFDYLAGRRAPPLPQGAQDIDPNDPRLKWDEGRSRDLHGIYELEVRGSVRVRELRPSQEAHELDARSRRSDSPPKYEAPQEPAPMLRR